MKTPDEGRAFRGVWVALVTPWRDGAPLYQALPELVSRFSRAGVAGLFVLGTTGEGTLLAPEVRREFAEAVVEESAGALPVIVHVGHDRPQVAAELARHAARIGAVAAAAAPPTRYRLTQEELVGYYLEILSAWGERPFFLYDIPSTTGNPLGAWLLSELGRRAPQLVGAKISRTDWPAWEEYLGLAGEMVLLVGADEMDGALLSLGADGLVSSCSNLLPELYVALYRAATGGDRDLVFPLQLKVIELCRLTQRGRVALIKEGLKLLGCEVGTPVPPLLPPGGEEAGAFKEAFGSLKAETDILISQGGDAKRHTG
jgi:dihydrodipicolinate synthase/N-acetylneuraminate lyase